MLRSLGRHAQVAWSEAQIEAVSNNMACRNGPRGADACESVQYHCHIKMLSQPSGVNWASVVRSFPTQSVCKRLHSLYKTYICYMHRQSITSIRDIVLQAVCMLKRGPSEGQKLHSITASGVQCSSYSPTITVGMRTVYNGRCAVGTETRGRCRHRDVSLRRLTEVVLVR